MSFNGSGSSGPVFDRAVCEYKNLSEKFIISTSDYSRQFSHIYTMRIKKMRENLVKAARAKWGNMYIQTKKYSTINKYNIIQYYT
jgi:hypothetical protein